MGVTSWVVFNSVILWFYWPVWGHDSFFQRPGKLYGNWTYRVWQETWSWLRADVTVGRMPSETTLCPSVLWIISSPSEGKRWRVKRFCSDCTRGDQLTVHPQGTSMEKAVPTEWLWPLKEGCLCLSQRLWLTLPALANLKPCGETE